MSKELPTLYGVSELTEHGRDYFIMPCADKEYAESMTLARRGHYPDRDPRFETLIPESRIQEQIDKHTALALGALLEQNITARKNNEAMIAVLKGLLGS